ncbi:MAG: 8-oxo-dGTP diphosphatase [Clostridiales bacterium]|nr:8-oxo-dGTP diphosphatase [Clostridiales bacterium]
MRAGMTPKIDFYEIEASRESHLIYAIICAQYDGKWIFVRHQERRTWEIPGGHIKPNEAPDAAARRELYEEAGAIKANVFSVCDYSVTFGDDTRFGRLFYAKVSELEETLKYETAETVFSDHMPEKLTYPDIQPILFGEVKKRIGLL